MKLVLSLSCSLIFLFAPSNSWSVPAEGSQIMIAAVSSYAVESGKEVSKRGGNVVDVAITVALTLAVTNPYFAAFGGGGFALVKNGKFNVDVLDFREVAPKKTSPQFYIQQKKDASITGGNAVGVPGIPAGLWALHKKYGKIHWSQLFRTPIRLAQKGFQVTGEWVKRTEQQRTRFNSGGMKHFFKKKNKSYRPGELFKQPALAKVLKEMRNRGTVSFYKGVVARDIVDTVKKSGGVLTLEDMKNYKVRWLKPITTEFEGHKIYLMPPPSSGGVVIASALKLSEKLKLKKFKTLSVDELHHIAELLSRSYRGRALLGDPDFNKNPIKFLLSDKYLEKMAKSIDDDESEKLDPFPSDFKPKESNETTHFSVLDHKGNAISMTITLNGNYGSAVVSNKFGVALNNEMDDFTTRPGKPNMYGLVQGKGNVVEPGKRPLSSMSPTLVEKDGKIVMAVGAPGGPRIISAVYQAIYRVLASGMNMDRAIQSPRVHHQFLPHKLFIDKGFRFTPETIKGLEDRDHKIEQSWGARVYGVRKNKEGNLEAAFDSRGDGAAGGY